jgi:chemotaxis response regulator CheB
VDISLQAVEGAAQTGKLVDALAAGDKVDANDQRFGASFPYVALPNVAAVNSGASASPPTAPAASPAAAPATSPPDMRPVAADQNTGRDAALVVAASVGGAAALLFLVTLGWLRRRARRI